MFSRRHRDWEMIELSMQAVITDESVVVAAGEQIFSNLGNDVVILHLSEGIYYGLDPVGARIWQLIQEPTAVRQVWSTLLEEYEVEPERCLADLLALLREMAQRNLVEAVPGEVMV